MPTDIVRSRHAPARDFALQGLGWSLALFGVMRLRWFEAQAILPLTEIQARLAARGFGAPALPVEVTLACSGADAFALCTAAILAYPAAWRMRIAGAAGGIAMILTLNTIRIGTLGRAAASPAWFGALHIYVWPALLTLAIAAYVFGWMRLANSSVVSQQSSVVSHQSSVISCQPAVTRERSPLTRRFVAMTAAFLVLFTAASPLYLESTGVLAVAAFIARAAAVILNLFGIPAVATANVLTTARGGLLVTQECITTPVIPVYLAAVFAYSTRWRSRAAALAAAVPLFVGLGIARLLVVALPAALVGSPLVLIHAFYQVLLAGVVVLLVAFWRHGAGTTAWGRALLGAALGGVFVYLAGPSYARLLVSAFAAGMPLEDPQGAIALLPSFQVGLYIALSLAAFAVLELRSFVIGLTVLGLSQVALFAALHLVIRQAGLMPQVRDVRAWALAGPLLLIVAMVTHGQPRR